MGKLPDLIRSIPKDQLKRVFKKSTLCLHMQEKRTPNLESARKYAGLLGVTLDEFYTMIEGEKDGVK